MSDSSLPTAGPMTRGSGAGSCSSLRCTTRPSTSPRWRWRRGAVPASRPVAGRRRRLQRRHLEKLRELERGVPFMRVLSAPRGHPGWRDRLAAAAVERAYTWALENVDWRSLRHIGKLDGDTVLPPHYLSGCWPSSRPTASRLGRRGADRAVERRLGASRPQRITRPGSPGSIGASASRRSAGSRTVWAPIRSRSPTRG